MDLERVYVVNGLEKQSLWGIALESKLTEFEEILPCHGNSCLYFLIIRVSVIKETFCHL